MFCAADQSINLCVFSCRPGSHSSTHSAARDLAYRDADVFLLCYKISDPTTLFSALNFWCPEVRAVAPATPVVLVGCQSDLRTDRDRLSALAKAGKAPVSSEQALSFSQQIGAAMYVETSARTSIRATISAFEVAALASMGKIAPSRGGTPPHTPSPKLANSKKQRFSSVSPGDSLDRTDVSGEQFWDRFNTPGAVVAPSSRMTRTLSEHGKKSHHTGSLGSCRSASLSSKTRSSSTSIPSISSSLGGSKTPKGSRKNSVKNGAGEKMITIKCQRLTADKTYEEIEVEVPAPIYDTIQLYNDTGSLTARGGKERRSLGSKLKNLFTKNN